MDHIHDYDDDLYVYAYEKPAEMMMIAGVGIGPWSTKVRNQITT